MPNLFLLATAVTVLPLTEVLDVYHQFVIIKRGKAVVKLCGKPIMTIYFISISIIQRRIGRRYALQERQAFYY